MKNKKLFAILTLVCFMFTLMPVAAFAATDYDADQVYVKEDGTWVDDADVKTGVNFEVGVSASGATPSATNYLFYAVDADGKGVALATTASATTLKISVAGDYEVKAINLANVAPATMTKVEAILADVDTVASKIAKLEAWAKGELRIADSADVTVEDNEVKFNLGLVQEDASTASTLDLDITADGGWNEAQGKVTVKLAADSAVLLKGKVLTFTPVGYVDLTFEDGKAVDKNGELEFKVTSKYVGDYKVIVSYGDAKATVNVAVKPATVANVAVNAEPAAAMNLDTVKSYGATGVEFKFTDKNAAVFKVATSGSAINGLAEMRAANGYKVAVVSQPADSKLKAENFTLVEDADAKDGVADLKVSGLKEEGKYTVRVTLSNGSSAEASFTVAEQGDVVAVKFSKAPTTIVYTAGAATSVIGDGIVTLDANGVANTALAPGSVEYSVVGKAVSQFTTAGALTLVTDADEYIGSTITVYAVYTEPVTNKVFTTSNTLTIIDAAETVVLKDATAEVGVSKVLYGNVVDSKGNVVKLGTVSDIKVVVLDKPENAIVVATPGSYSDATGVPVNFLASAAGEYKVQIIVIDSNNRYLTAIETIVVGGGVNTFDDVVVLSIGSNNMIVNNKVVALDVAPFVAEGRTMMQYTALSAFGIEFAWNEADRTVTAEGNGVKIVMTIDSKVATVNGKTVVMEVAPTIQNGRTVVPVTYVTNAFGIIPTAIYDANGVCDVLFTK